MPEFSQASKDKLATCDQRLQDILYEAIHIVDFTVIEGHRGQAAQNEAYATGKSKLQWPNGNHNALPSRAVDIAPYLKDSPHVDWKDIVAFGRLMGIVQGIAFRHNVRLRFGVDWDGDFRSLDETFMDAPHVELA